MKKQIPSSLIKFIYLLTAVNLIFWSCSGLVKLNLPSQENVEKEDVWLTAYKNNQRHNAVVHDLDPPYQILWDKKYRSVITDHPLAIFKYIIATFKNGNLALFDIEQGGMLGDGRIAPGFIHVPTIENNILYFGANLGNNPLIAMDLRSLDKVWEARLPHIYTSPLVWNHRVFAGSNRAVLFCLDQATGEIIWQFSTQSGIFGVPAEKDGLIYTCDVDGIIYCIDGSEGEEKWRSQLSSNVYSGPLLAEEKVFIGTSSGKIYALDAHTGNEIWQIETGGSIYANAAYKKGFLYVGNNSHKVFAVSAADGKILWEFKTRGIVNSTPLVGEDFIYFGSWDKSLYVLSRISGEEIYKHEFEKPIKSSPIIYKKRLFVHTANDYFYCLATANIQ